MGLQGARACLIICDRSGSNIISTFKDRRSDYKSIQALSCVLTACVLPGNCSISTSNRAEEIRSHSRKEVKDNHLSAVQFLILVLCDVVGAAL